MNSNPYSNPYSSPTDPTLGLPPHLRETPKKASSATKIAFWIVGILGSICLVCCLSGTGLWFFSTWILAETVKDQFNDHPIVQREIGDIETITLKFRESVEEQMNSNRDTFIYDVSGAKGTGKIAVAEQVDDHFNWAELRTENGVFELTD